MLNPVAKKWVEALRSGKYEQGYGHLHSGDKYCCLGVLCDLAVKEGVIKKFDGTDAALPKRVRKWAHLFDSMGAYDADHTLANQNDYCDSDFLQIADIIESEPEGLFEK